jgi:ABC-type bacteriocin/lantibiotic exporter with double-glycine peptidase domain
MRRIRQRDETDCAAACLAAIAHYYRLELSVSGIRLLAGTGAAGTTVLGVVHAAESLGFSAKGVKGASEHLAEVPLPCIAHVVPEPRAPSFRCRDEGDTPQSHRDGSRGGRHQATFTQAV